MKFYKTKITYDYLVDAGEEVNNEPSQCIPGETRTIKQILDRYQKTGTLPNTNPQWFDVEDIKFINQYYQPGALDFTDYDALRDHSEKLSELIDKQKTNNQAEEASQHNDSEA